MEELEDKKLQAYEAKKSLERSRREAKKVAHQKVVCRATAKQYNRDLKVNTLVLLKDIGYFSDRFREQVLDADVMPWIFDQTENFAKQMGSYNAYPNTLIAGYIEEASNTHVQKVKAHEQKLADIKKAEEEASAAKKAEKQRRRAERERARREAERKELEGTIEKTFIEAAKTVENVLQQDIIEADGWGQANKPVVTALGGFFGQLIIVLNTVAHYYPQLDRPLKSGRSGRVRESQPKTPTESERSGRRKSERSEAAASEAPRAILNPGVVQNFIFNYVGEKLKTEKLNLLVDAKFEKFLNSLPTPLELNNIRTLKEEKYVQFRQLIARHTGSPLLKLIKHNAEALDLDPDVFDLAYEGFWDLYTLRPKVKDVSAKKLQQEWIKKINLKAGESKGDDDAGAEEGKPAQEEAEAEEDAKEEDEKPEG